MSTRIVRLLHDERTNLFRVVADDGLPMPPQLVTFAMAAELAGVEQGEIEDAIIDDGLTCFQLGAEGIVLRVDGAEVTSHFHLGRGVRR